MAVPPVLPTRRAISDARRRRPTISVRRQATSALVLTAVTAFVATMIVPSYAYTAEDAPAAVAEAETVTVTVADDANYDVFARDQFGATTVVELASARATALAATYRASSVAQAGDDYPWRDVSMLKTLSPLRYVYRECVDFVVWRLNRDVGSIAAPFAYTWGYLTPNGGNARDFKAAWEAHGWPTSHSPVAGDIAWWGNNHVAYVKSVDAAGNVSLEEYNATPFMYSTRTIPADKVDMFLSPPPR
jgi:surface antigen